MILHTQWDTTLIADAATVVEDFYSLKQIQTVIRPRSCPLLCQFLMKIIIVINLVCACIKTSAEEDDFSKSLKGGGGERERERETERERVWVSVCFITLNYEDAVYVQFNVWLCFTMRSNDKFNFLLGWIKYYVMLSTRTPSHKVTSYI